MGVRFPSASHSVNLGSVIPNHLESTPHVGLRHTQSACRATPGTLPCGLTPVDKSIHISSTGHPLLLDADLSRGTTPRIVESVRQVYNPLQVRGLGEVAALCSELRGVTHGRFANPATSASRDAIAGETPCVSSETVRRNGESSVDFAEICQARMC